MPIVDCGHCRGPPGKGTLVSGSVSALLRELTDRPGLPVPVARYSRLTSSCFSRAERNCRLIGCPPLNTRDTMGGRVLKPAGTFWLAIGDELAAELKVAMRRTHVLHCRGWVVWYYTFGVNCTHKFSRSQAHLFHMVKDPERYTFNKDDPDVRVPSARQLVYGDKRANPKGRLPDDTWILRPQDLEQGFGADEDT